MPVKNFTNKQQKNWNPQILVSQTTTVLVSVWNDCIYLLLYKGMDRLVVSFSLNIC